MRIFTWLMLTTLLAAGSARAELAIDCPELVPEGTAFTLGIAVDSDIDSLTVEWLGRSIRPRLAGVSRVRVLLGVGMRERLEGESWPLRVTAWRGGAGEIVLCEVRRGPRDYPEQHLQVDRKYTELGPEELARHEREKAAVSAVKRLDSPALAAWPLPFMRPVGGRVTSEFGFRRFFNGEAKNPHSGVDLAGAHGTPVLSCADGTVVLADDHFFAGRSVYVDHGEGIVSMYFHLTEIRVEPGQRVVRGQIVGTVGDSGRVTGPHLHWGLSLHGQLVDPLPLVDSAAP